MDHGGQVKLKVVFSQVQFFFIFYDNYIISNTVIPFQHFRCTAVSHYFYLGITGLKQFHGTGMIRLHMIDDKIIDLLVP
ncbi:hypothetical protein SDC9_178652 [bioreactor metagenome]|uniref:Uncharacterized protein n=1 Tax=bioreactor metagenome TaxID=1076179 RepID=A0A645GWS5_9ZZZZ